MSRLTDLKLLRSGCPLDVLVTVETWLTDFDVVRPALRAALPGARMFAVNHPFVPAARRGTRGVAVLVFNRAISVSPLHADPGGVLALRLQSPGTRPVALVATYLPPPSGSAEAVALRKRLLRVILEVTTRLLQSPLYDEVLLVGDLNGRLGTFGGRHTQDKRAPAQCDLVPLLEALSMSPVHGRPGREAAPVTSRSPSYASASRATGEHEAEVDYICGRLSSGAVPWAAPLLGQFTEGTSHAPIAVRLPLTSLGHPGPAPQPRQRRPPPPPPYSDDRAWKAAGQARLAALAGSPTTGLLHAPTLEAGRDALLAVVNNSPPAAPVPDEDPANGRAGGKPRGKGSPPRSLVHRSFRGWSLPPHLVALCKRIRGLYRAATAWNLSEEERSRRRSILAVACKNRKQTLRRWLATIRDGMVARLLAQARRDPGGLAREMQLLRPADPLILTTGNPSIPDAPGQPPAVQRFHTYFAGVMRESRPPLSPAETAAFLADVVQAPAGAGDWLAAPFTPQEVLKCIFPISAACRDIVASPCHDGCPTCAAELAALDAHRTHPALVPIPVLRPSLNTNVAGGPDGLRAEYIRWPRLTNIRDTVDLRLRLAAAIARHLSHCLAVGDWPADGPDGLVHQVLVPVPKRGAGLDPADPASYRPITLVPTLVKVLELVLLRRLSHFAEAHGLLHPSQAGFRTGRGAEEQILALREAIAHRGREGQPTAVLFVDFKGAYDAVPQELLYATLHHVGVPTATVSLLAALNRRRAVRVRVNGQLSDPIRVEKGVPQGGPLSPLLWNLFMDGLLRRAHASHTFNGVTLTPRRPTGSDAPPPLPAGLVRSTAPARLCALAYADDVALLCTDAAQVRAALDVVADWASRARATIGAGAGKTQAVWFPAPPSGRRRGSAALPRPPLPIPGGAVVPWGEGYRYLGTDLRADLDLGPTVDRVAAAVKAAATRFLFRSPVVRNLPLHLQIQLAQTYVSGAASYALCALNLTSAQWAALDAPHAHMLRYLLDTPHPITPRRHLQVPGLPAPSVRAAAARLRLLLATCTPQGATTPLGAVLSVAVVGRGAGKKQATRSWLDVTLTETLPSPLQAAERGISLPPMAEQALPPWRIHGAVASFRRSLADALWWESVMEDAACDGDSHPVALDSDDRPRSVPARAALHDLQAVGHPTTHPQPPTGPPLSANGVGGVGPLWAYASRPATALRPIIRLPLGRLTVILHPFAAPHLTAAAAAGAGAGAGEGAGEGAAPRRYDNVHALRAKLATIAHPCLLCQRGAVLERAGDAAVEDGWHIVTQCGHPGVAAARRAVASSAPAFLRRLIAALRQAHQSVHEGALPPYAPIADAVLAAVSGAGEGALDMASQEGRWILFRLLAVAPWPAAAAADSHTVVRGLGRIFDLTVLPRQHLRRIATSWCSWAARSIRRVLAARRAAYTAATAARAGRGATPPTPPPPLEPIPDDEAPPPLLEAAGGPEGGGGEV